MAGTGRRRHGNDFPAQFARHQLKRLRIPRHDVLVPLVADDVEQGLVRLNEFFDAFVFELRRDDTEIDAGFLQPCHHPTCLADTLRYRVARFAVVDEGGDGFFGHGVDGVRPNQRLDIHDVAIRRILGAGAGPKHPLGPGTTLRQRLPALAGDQVLEAPISQLGVGDACLAEQGCGLRSSPLAQQLIDQHIDAAEKKARHGCNVVDGTTPSKAPLQRP